MNNNSHKSNFKMYSKSDKPLFYNVEQTLHSTFEKYIARGSKQRNLIWKYSHPNQNFHSLEHTNILSIVKVTKRVKNQC